MPRPIESIKITKSVYMSIPTCIRVEEEARKRGKSFSVFVEEAVLLYLALLESGESDPFLKELQEALSRAVREGGKGVELALYAQALATSLNKEKKVSSGG